MKPADILLILENEGLPERVRFLARALLIAMLALERYGHDLSYSHDGAGSEADRDGGMSARKALDEIRNVEHRLRANEKRAAA